MKSKTTDILTGVYGAIQCVMPELEERLQLIRALRADLEIAISHNLNRANLETMVMGTLTEENTILRTMIAYCARLRS